MLRPEVEQDMLDGLEAELRMREDLEGEIAVLEYFYLCGEIQAAPPAWERTKEDAA